MPDPITGIVVAGSQLIGGVMQSRSAGKAADAQTEAAERGIEEQRRQFEAVQEILRPYVQAGTTAIGGLQPYAAAGAPAPHRWPSAPLSRPLAILPRPWFCTLRLGRRQMRTSID